MLNDLQNCLKLSSAILFADDTTLYIQGRNENFLITKMQRELNLLNEWLFENGLSLNISKTKYMILTKKGNISYAHKNLIIDGKIIEQVDCFKLLGVQLDHHLTFENHVSEVNHKINQYKFLIRKLSKFLPVHCLRTIYFSFVHSRLVYGISSWGSLIGKELLSTLVKQQKSVVRIINGKGPLTHSSPLFLHNKIMKLEDIIDMEMLLMVHKYQTNKLPRPVSNLFVTKDHNYNTRQRGIPTVQKHASGMFNKSFMNQALKKWEENKYLFDQVSTKRGLKKSFKYHCFMKY